MCTLVTRKVTFPMTSSFSLMRNVPLEDGRWWYTWPLRRNIGIMRREMERGALWGTKSRFRLFFLSLSNEKKDDLMEGKMVWLQCDLCDREVSQKCWNTSLGTTSRKNDTWLWNLYIYIDEHKVDMEYTGISVIGVDRRTVGHTFLQAAPGCILKWWINISAVWKIHSIKIMETWLSQGKKLLCGRLTNGDANATFCWETWVSLVVSCCNIVVIILKDIVSDCGIGAQGVLLIGNSPGEYEE